MGFNTRVMPAISRSSTVVASQDQVSCEVHGEAAILQMKAGIYYSLDRVGARVWQSIQKPIPVSDLCSLITSEYDVEPARCEQDLLELLEQLATAGLIEVK
jgi:hypothetical protein